MNTPYANYTPAAIAANVSVMDAADAIARRECDRSGLACNAFHEAAHIVVDACLGYRTAAVYIPVLDPHGSVIKPGFGHWQWPGFNTSPGWQQAGQEHASTFQALYQRDDLTTALEDATGSYAGLVAEQVLARDGRRSIPKNSHSDYSRAQANIADFEQCARSLPELPHAPPIDPNPSAKQQAKKNERNHLAHHRRTLGTAQTLVGRHYVTIDAVAAIILCHGNNGVMWWTPEHQKWLNLALQDGYRPRVRRKLLIKPPPWLTRVAQAEPANFARVRRNVKMLQSLKMAA